VAFTRSRGRGAAQPWVLARRVAVAGAVVAALLFAIMGGEYGWRDVRTRTARRERLEAEVAQLRAVVDSLRAELALVEQDPATIERIAREEYGMVRGSRELLYRFVEEEEAP
jgi:cell division protein FtsB